MHFNSFVQMLVEILQNVQADTLGKKTLRARAIETIGSIVGAVTECEPEEKDSFKGAVLEISNHLSSNLKTGLTDDDP